MGRPLRKFDSIKRPGARGRTCGSALLSEVPGRWKKDGNLGPPLQERISRPDATAV
jgi:hypothetical protein